MDLKKLREPLTVDQIDFRIQSINKGGYATILAYKDARVDMQRLDDVCGPLNWERVHTRDNKNCTIRVWDDHKKLWVSKEDTGVESYTEKEKGLASDSFKRAGFNWGIGRELYDYPRIQIKLAEDEIIKKGEKVQASWKLRLGDWKWESKFKNKKITFLQAIDTSGEVRFRWECGEEVTASPETKPPKIDMGDDVPLDTSPATNVAPLWKQLVKEIPKNSLDQCNEWYTQNKNRIENMLQGKNLVSFMKEFSKIKSSLEPK